MKRLSILVFGLFLLLPLAQVAQAITTVTRDFDQLVARADTVFKGEVTSKNSQWTGKGATRHIVTFVTFKVEEIYKGPAANEQTLRFLGGTVGDDSMEIPDMPKFDIGQRAVLFVVGNGKQFCPLVGVAQGRFHVVKEAATGQDHILTDDHSPVVNTRELGQVDESGTPRLKRYAATGTPAMSAAAFRAEILGKIAALPH